MARKNYNSIEELFEAELIHKSYQRALCEDFSFLDNFMNEEDNSND